MGNETSPPTLPTGTDATTTPAPTQSLVKKIGPHSLKILIGAAVVGAIALILPAASVLGFSTGGWINGWQGMLSLVGYIAVGVMSGLMLQKTLSSARQLVLASLITAGVVTLLALWMFLSIATASGVSVGIGTILNVLAALVVLAGAVLEAKKAKIF